LASSNSPRGLEREAHRDELLAFAFCVMPHRREEPALGADERGDVRVLEAIRDRFRAAAESCNKGAKAIVAAVNKMLEERRGSGHSRSGRP
jgi:hypothetical protein